MPRSALVGGRRRVHAELRQFDDAWRCVGEAITAVETTKQRWCEAEVNRMAGEIARKSLEPDTSKAEVYFERALTVARRGLLWTSAALTSS